MNKKPIRVARNILDVEMPPLDSERLARIEDSRSPLKLDSNESTVAPSITAITAAEIFIRKRRLNWNPDTTSTCLKSQIAGHINLPADFVECYASSDLALGAIMRTYLEAGQKILNISAAANSLDCHGQSLGVDTIHVAGDSPFAVNVENIIDNICPRTRLIYLSNPDIFTGAVLTEPEIIFLLAYAENSMVVIDESLVDFYGRSVAELAARFRNLIVLRSFSFAAGLASLGTGYIITDPGNLEFIRRVSLGAFPNSLAQAACSAALGDINHIRQLAISVDQSKKLLSQNLKLLGYEFHIGAGNSFLLKTANPEALICQLENDEIFISNRLFEGSLAGYVHITIGNPMQTERLLMALARITEKSLDSIEISDAAVNRITGKIDVTAVS